MSLLTERISNLNEREARYTEHVLLTHNNPTIIGYLMDGPSDQFGIVKMLIEATVLLYLIVDRKSVV